MMKITIVKIITIIITASFNMSKRNQQQTILMVNGRHTDTQTDR